MKPSKPLPPIPYSLKPFWALVALLVLCFYAIAQGFLQ